MQLGLRILRGAVWTAALTVTAVQTRHACYSTADAFISAVTQLKLRYQPPRHGPALQGSQADFLADQDEGSKEPVEVTSCSVDVAAGGAGLLETAPAGLS